MFTIRRLNHIVLYVRDAQASLHFYRDVLGFSVVESFGAQALFLRASGSDNHHDLGLFGIAAGSATPTARGAPGIPGAPATPRAMPGSPRVGLYHAAWEVAAIEDLAEARDALGQAGALTGSADHGNSLSLYGSDPDGIEFEVFWMVPREEWATRGFGTRPLDLEAELAKRRAPAR